MKLMVSDQGCEDLTGADNIDNEANDRYHWYPFQYLYLPVHLEVLFALMPRNVTDETYYLISQCTTPFFKCYPLH
jgi:hypothetical protein